MVEGKQGHAPSKMVWLRLSKDMLLVKCCGCGKQGHASCKILSLKQMLSLCQLYFMKIIRLSESQSNVDTLSLCRKYKIQNNGVSVQECHADSSH